MDAAELRAIQAPWKEKYRTDPASALATMRATGTLDPDRLICVLETQAGVVEAGLHPSTGGDGLSICSAQALLEALAGCAGVTLRAVATAMGVKLRGGRVEVEGDLDFRGTLGVDKSVPIGFRAIRARIAVDADAPAETVEKLVRLTEKYCVVHQTLLHPPEVSLTVEVGKGAGAGAAGAPGGEGEGG